MREREREREREAEEEEEEEEGEEEHILFAYILQGHKDLKKLPPRLYKTSYTY